MSPLDRVAHTGLSPLSGSDFNTILAVLDSSKVSEESPEQEFIFTYTQSFRSDDLSAYERAFDRCVALYRAILQMPDATPEDRFFAYYGWISLYNRTLDFSDNPQRVLFEKWKEETSNMSPTHWVHEEVELWRRWL